MFNLHIVQGFTKNTSYNAKNIEITKKENSQTVFLEIRSSHYFTVPLKSKLTVPRASRLDTRSSILDSFEYRVSSLESRVSSIELRVEKVNELVAWLISREINCTNGLPVLRAIVPLSLVITKMRATDSIVNTDKGSRVFSCDIYANEWMNLPPK